MTIRALVIDDDEEIIRTAGQILDSMGHAYDAAQDQEAARKLLGPGKYAYVLLDLRIPVRPGGLTRIENGKNLLSEIQQTPGMEDVPVLVMTSYGNEGPDLAVEVMRMGAAHFFTKPFVDTLDRKIREALAGRAKTHHSVGKPAAPSSSGKPQPFKGGEMVFYPGRVELCGVIIISDKGTEQSIRMLQELRQRDDRSRYVRRSARKLADAIGAKGNVGTVTGCARTIRQNIKTRLLKERNVECQDEDVLVTDQQGYHLNDWITVKDGRSAHGDVPANVPVATADVPPKCPSDDPGDISNVPSIGPGVLDVPANERQTWALEQMRSGATLRRDALERKFHVSEKTAKRDLAELVKGGRVEYVRAPHPGFYRLRALAVSRRSS